MSAAALGALLLASGRAYADAPCGARRWVELASSALPREFVRNIERDLGAGLAPSQIDVCEPDGVQPAGGPPIAKVVLEPSPDSPNLFSIDVTDSLTHKRIGRDIDLGKVPADGRSFALAVATDELLRASWAELTLERQTRAAPALLKDAQPPAPEKRPDETRGDLGAIPSQSTDSDAAGVRFGFEHYVRAQTQIGADAFWVHSIGSSFQLQAALGMRGVFPIESQEGSIGGSALLAQIGVGPWLARTGSIRLAALVILAGSRVAYAPHAGANATATPATGYALYARGGLDLSLGGPGFPVRSRTTAGIGAPLRSFAAADSGGVVTGVKGLEIFAATGAAIEF